VPQRSSGVSALPSPIARAAALFAVLVAGLCGALIGWAVFDLQTDGSVWPAIGMVLGGVLTGGGVAVVAVLALRASTEWRQKIDPAAPGPAVRLGGDRPRTPGRPGA
jgi:hypothetical protein